MASHGATLQTGESPSRWPAWRRRLRLAWLALLVLAGLAIAALEKYRGEESYRLWSRGYQWLSPVVEPAQRSARGQVHHAFDLRELWRAEQRNDLLQRELATLRLRNDLLVEQVTRLERLSGLGEWAAPPQLRFLPADVTGILTTDQSMLLVINRGRRDGVRERDPVVALGGLVGIAHSVYEDSARVQAITDPMSVVGAATLQTRARGAVYGGGRNEPLEFIPENEALEFGPGSRLITSGFENSNFPKGIVIGEITERGIGTGGMPYGRVRSAVHFDSIEEVLVIITNERSRGGASAPRPAFGTVQIRMPGSEVTKPDLEPAVTSPTLAAGAAQTGATTGTLAGDIPSTAVRTADLLGPLARRRDRPSTGSAATTITTRTISIGADAATTPSRQGRPR